MEFIKNFIEIQRNTYRKGKMKKIDFILDPGFYGKETIKPVPSQDIIPLWWREGESFINVEDRGLNILQKSQRAPGMKSCVPFLDAITSGYLILTWQNIEITKNSNNKVEFRVVEKDKNGNWQGIETDKIMIEERVGGIGYTMPRPAGFAFNHLAFSLPWGWKVPKNWSVLVTHPFNRNDLPYFSTSGIIDSDQFPLAGRVPFFIKDGWTGVIERGSPIVQLIPIKRASWISYFKASSYADIDLAKALRGVQYGFYRKHLWQKKKYLSQELED